MEHSEEPMQEIPTCPTGYDTAEQQRLGRSGCGSTNVIGPDSEGIYDCLDCGLFFVRPED
jgi:hypothetical protein